MGKLAFLLLTLVLAAVSVSGVPSKRRVLKPPRLEEGDKICLIAPASPLARDKTHRVVEYFRTKGYGVILYGDAKAQDYLAGSDEERIRALNAAFRDPEVKAVVCLRGGYGSPRIVDRIDYDLIRNNPKILVGYSDITALLNAIQARTGLVVFHGPMGTEFCGRRGPSPVCARHFWSALQPASPLFRNWGSGTPASKRSLKTLVPGAGEGTLVGGNLSVLTCTLGTPYELDARDGILFLEDVSEKPFRIDRMINQLRLSGKLAELRGILLGQFTNCRPASPNGRDVETIFMEYFGELGVPVLSGFPAGHVTDQVTLPLGIRVRLDATAKTLTLLEAPVE